MRHPRATSPRTVRLLRGTPGATSPTFVLEPTSGPSGLQTRTGDVFVVCGSLIQVRGLRVSYIVGFRIEALVGMSRGCRGGAAPPGAVADVNDPTQVLMITILPAYM